MKSSSLTQGLFNVVDYISRCSVMHPLFYDCLTAKYQQFEQGYSVICSQDAWGKRVSAGCGLFGMEGGIN